MNVCHGPCSYCTGNCQPKKEKSDSLKELLDYINKRSTAISNGCNPNGCFCTGKCRENKVPCLWDSLSPEDIGKPMGISCPCPRCSPFSMDVVI